MDDDDVRRRDLVEAHRRQHRLAGIVHEGLRPQQQAPRAGDHPFGEFALEAVAKRREAVAPGDRLGRHEADIVAVAGIARARIAEPDDQAHRLTEAQDDGADPGAAPGAAPGAVPGAAAGCSPSSGSGGAAAAVAAATAAAAASSRTAEEAAIVAIVKSRSWITGRAPSGISTAPIWMLSPISSPSRSTTIRSGMLSTEQTTSMPCRTMLRMPPRRSPGARSWLMNTTGTSTVTWAPAPTRRKSTWSGVSVTGWNCTSRGRVRYVVPLSLRSIRCA